MSGIEMDIKNKSLDWQSMGMYQTIFMPQNDVKYVYFSIIIEVHGNLLEMSSISIKNEII